VVGSVYGRVGSEGDGRMKITNTPAPRMPKDMLQKVESLLDGGCACACGAETCRLVRSPEDALRLVKP
jgi:hypothetical protein